MVRDLALGVRDPDKIQYAPSSASSASVISPQDVGPKKETLSLCPRTRKDSGKEPALAVVLHRLSICSTMLAWYSRAPQDFSYFGIEDAINCCVAPPAIPRPSGYLSRQKG